MAFLYCSPQSHERQPREQENYGLRSSLLPLGKPLRLSEPQFSHLQSSVNDTPLVCELWQKSRLRSPSSQQALHYGCSALTHSGQAGVPQLGAFQPEGSADLNSKTSTVILPSLDFTQALVKQHLKAFDSITSNLNISISQGLQPCVWFCESLGQWTPAGWPFSTQ